MGCTKDPYASPIQQKSKDNRADCIYCKQKGICKLHTSLDASNKALESFKKEGKIYDYDCKDCAQLPFSCSKHMVKTAPEEAQEYVPDMDHTSKDVTRSSDWKEKEREAFKKNFAMNCMGNFVLRTGDQRGADTKENEIADYWLSRIEAARAEEREEQNRIHNSGRKLYQIGYAAALEEVIEIVSKIYVGWSDRTEGRDSSYDDAFEDGYEVTHARILAALSALKEKPE